MIYIDLYFIALAIYISLFFRIIILCVKIIKEG